MDPEPLPNAERSDAKPFWRATLSSPPMSQGAAADDAPTVRRGPGGSGGSGSSRRVELVGEPGLSPVPSPLGLPQPGERIDMFGLEASIGVGGMGAVFRAQDIQLDRHVALKILPPEQANDSEVVQRFYQEGRAAARLDHENIARVFSIGHDGRYHYIAFEYIEGTTIRQRVETHGPLPVSEAINYTLQIADALVHASERGVVHRDIKPSNIIVTPHGRAKLVDMGLARRFERGGDDGLTQSGMTLGTFDYISPEQARDPRDVDVRSDLYSLGCTLFHMLTSRPPFPEGTVLQKLIQHQEEPPPDVRALNPSVPPDLAAILIKLMAKDRDRRYQTPEQLVRDLLTVAGSLGLRSVSPEGLVWLSAEPAPAWERHLVWGVPALVLAAVVGGLVWWGQDSGSVPNVSSADPAPAPILTVKSADPLPPPAPSVKPSPALLERPRREATLPNGPAVSPTASVPIAGSPSNEEPVPDEAPPAATRTRSVSSTDDLLAALAEAPPRGVILLTERGPYVLGPDTGSGKGRLTLRDVTIKADAGVRPVLQGNRNRPLVGQAQPALLDLLGGSVTLEGLDFLLDPPDPTAPFAAVRAEDVELTVRRCVFRTAGADASRGGNTRLAAIELREHAAVGERPPVVTLDRSHIEGDMAGIRATGPVDLLLRDCTLAGRNTAVWLENGRSDPVVPAEVRLKHVSVLAGDAPIFRFEGTGPLLRVDDSVFAPGASQGDAVLVASDRPDALDWRGRGNLYARIDTFLLSNDPRLARLSVRDPAHWEESADSVRETGSSFVTTSRPIWADPSPAAALAKEDRTVSRAFRLAAGHPGAADVGARFGPLGESNAATTVGLVAAGAGTMTSQVESAGARVGTLAPVPERSTSVAGLSRGGETAGNTSSPLKTTEPATSTDGSDTASEIAKMGEMPVIPVMPPAGQEKDKDNDKEKPETSDEMDVLTPPTGETTTTATSSASGKPSTPTAPRPIGDRPPPARGNDEDVLLNANQLLNALSAPHARGGELRVASDADWVLPGLRIRAGVAWRVKAVPGTTRPRVRFLPPPVEPIPLTEWTAMFELASGSLQLEGFDVILPAMNSPRTGRWAAFAVWPGTELSMSNCTVTVEGDQVDSAVVAVTGGNPEVVGPANGAEVSAASVLIDNSLLRAGGDLVDVGAGRLVLDLSNDVVSTGRSVVHAHGVPRGQVAQRVNLTLRHITARSGGGLLRLETTPNEPDLAVADVTARDSILATTAKDVPLVRVDAQDAPAAGHEKVDWEGHGVAYHQITTYRCDQSAQVGAGPVLYHRSDWRLLVGGRETGDFHGDVRFLKPWPPDRPAWELRRSDVRLDPDGPAPSAGALLDRVPAAPPSS